MALGETDKALDHFLSAVKIRHALAAPAWEELAPDLEKIEGSPAGLKTLADLSYFGEDYEKAVSYISRLVETESNPDNLTWIGTSV